MYRIWKKKKKKPHYFISSDKIENVSICWFLLAGSEQLQI